jgi:hypothetical protein
MDLKLREGYSIKFCMKLIAVISQDKHSVGFIALSANWFNNELLPLIRKLYTLLQIETMSL